MTSRLEHLPAELRTHIYRNLDAPSQQSFRSTSRGLREIGVRPPEPVPSYTVVRYRVSSSWPDGVQLLKTFQTRESAIYSN
jgi:hypothetical protein